MMLVETVQGTLEGVSSRAVNVFKGIPFARPPVGPLRFLPPEPPEPWADVRPAKEYGPAVPQVRDELLEAMFGLAPFPAEEASCLSLNVWAPATAGKERPVLVWLHGGGFMTGSGRDLVFDGTRLAERQGLVVVTVNYRVGVLGFLQLAELLGDRYEQSGNAGLLDQLAALRWVRDNIAAFGGDPGNVTLAGQSAGGMCTAALTTVPAAKGLFHKAIVQSGSAELVYEQEKAASVTRELLATLDLDGPARLTEVPVAALLSAQSKVADAMRARGDGLGLPFAPVVDGKVLTETPLSAIRKGRAAGIPMIIGTNRDEGRLTQMLPEPPPLDDETMALIGDLMFQAPSDRFAEAQAGQAGGSVWRYLFTWPSTAREGSAGACHSLELPFVFDNLDRPGVRQFTGPRPPQELADAMSGAWASFARTGTPGWPSYDPAHRRTMIFDASP